MKITKHTPAQESGSEDIGFHGANKPVIRRMPAAAWLVPGFFFLSGFTALLYEILWTRMLVSVIGGSPFAVSIVLTVFMGGLGVGALAGTKLVRLARRRNTFLATYGALELLIGLYGLALPWLIALSKPIAGALYNTLYTSFLPYHLLVFLGCAALLILPTIFMGATLPVLSAFYVNRFSRLGTQAGSLYGVNTIGAAAGSLASGFALIPAIGMNGTLALAVLLNTIIGTGALLLARRTEPGNAVQPADERPPTVEHTIAAPEGVRPALAIFAISGFCGMAVQIIWTRLLGVIVGPTTYSFTIVVTSYILGLAIGSMVFGYLADRARDPLKWLIRTQAGAAVAMLAVSHFLGNSQMFFAKLIMAFQDHFLLLAVLKIAVLFAFFIVPTILFGAAFPLVLRIITPSLRGVGRSVGIATALNTAGAVLGAFAAGFLLIPLLGKESAIRVIVALQAGAALAGAFALYRREGEARAWLRSGAGIAAVLVLLAIMPYWNRELLSVGRYHRIDDEQLAGMGWAESLLFGTGPYGTDSADDVVYFADGTGGFTTVARHTDVLGRDGFSLYNNGKPDASSDVMDMYTQTLLAHIPLLMHDRPDTVMVLGMASGITAGEVLTYPVRKLDIVEINREVIGASEFFRPWNGGVLDDPRAELILQDGRAHLDLTSRRYDLIISEPSNPWMAGLAVLFTREFFTIARERLHPDGMFVQWIHGYQIDWDTFALVGRTFAEVFPNCLLVDIDPAAGATDYLLVGINGGRMPDPEIIRKNLPFAQRSTNLHIESPLTLFRLIVSDQVAELFGTGPVNTDSNARLEFHAPRVMYRNTSAEILDRILREGRLTARTADIQKQALNSVGEQISYTAFAMSFDAQFPGIVNLAGATPEERARFEKLALDYCGSHYVSDFRFIGDDALEKDCLRAQISFMLEQDGPSADRADLSYHTANLYTLLEDYRPAMEWYGRAIEADPGNYLAHYNRGGLLSMEGRFREAEEEYRETLRIRPDHALSYNNLGNVYARQGKLKEAVPFYRDALKMEPMNALAHRNLGNVLMNLGQTDEGELHRREADRLEAGNQ